MKCVREKDRDEERGGAVACDAGAVGLAWSCKDARGISLVAKT